MLKRVCGVLDEHGVHYSLDAGTLLGIVRENRLLPWDNDMDLMCPRVEWPKLEGLLDQLRRLGYRVRVINHVKDDPPMLKTEARIIKIYARRFWLFRGIGLDIFIKTKVEDRYMWAEGITRYARKSVPAHFHDELDTVEFDGQNYPIPADVDGYLTQRYGDWRTPNKNWDHIHDDKALY